MRVSDLGGAAVSVAPRNRDKNCRSVRDTSHCNSVELEGFAPAVKIAGMEGEPPPLAARRKELEAIRDAPDGLTRLAQIRYKHLWRRGELGSVSLDSEKLIEAILRIEFPSA